MRQHTPGPWKSKAGQVWSAAGMVADCGHHIPVQLSAVSDMRQARANADLIAAAPELLEALRAITDHFAASGDPTASDLMRNARSVIAKVKM